jgi:hypothetical protein
METERILAFYINVGNVSNDEVDAYVEKAIARFGDKPENERHYYIPVRGQESKVELIYSK